MVANSLAFNRSFVSNYWMPSDTKKRKKWILWAIGLGFLSIIAVSALVEVTGLFGLLRESRPENYLLELAIYTGILAFVAVPVLLIVNRLLSRLQYLEGLMHVCAWCKQVNLDEEWMPYDKFVKIKFDANTSHGICGDCKNQMQLDRDELQAKKSRAIAT